MGRTDLSRSSSSSSTSSSDDDSDGHDDFIDLKTSSAARLGTLPVAASDTTGQGVTSDSTGTTSGTTGEGVKAATLPIVLKAAS